MLEIKKLKSRSLRVTEFLVRYRRTYVLNNIVSIEIQCYIFKFYYNSLGPNVI